MQPNVILVSLDTLRADVAFSGKFPTIERLRADGVACLTAVSSSPLTPVSHATVLTGLQPPGHGIRHLLREKLHDGIPTLATLLAGAGYRTGGVVASPGLNRWYGLDRGFEWYDDQLPLLADGRSPLEVVDVKLRGTALKRAPEVVDRALGWVLGKPPPFFLFAHFFDAHWPYQAPEDFGSGVENPYEGEVAFMDHYLGVLLDRLEAGGHPLADAVIVLLSDHGEDLAGWYADDHAGDRGHPEEDGHGCLLFDVTQLVPLVICGGGRLPKGVAVQGQVRLVDVAPTLLDLLGVRPPARLDGRSIVPLLRGEQLPPLPAYSETYYPEEKAAVTPGYEHLRPLHAVRVDDGNGRRHKVIWDASGERVEVYDLAEDPAERRGSLLTSGRATAWST